MNRRDFLKLVGVACVLPALPKLTKVYGPMVPFKNGVPTHFVVGDKIRIGGRGLVCVTAGDSTSRFRWTEGPELNETS